MFKSAYRVKKNFKKNNKNFTKYKNYDSQLSGNMNWTFELHKV